MDPVRLIPQPIRSEQGAQPSIAGILWGPQTRQPSSRSGSGGVGISWRFAHTASKAKAGENEKRSFGCRARATGLKESGVDAMINFLLPIGIENISQKTNGCSSDPAIEIDRKRTMLRAAGSRILRLFLRLNLRRAVL